ncbi:MAG: CbiX/SirB N-terminal domain-containing protein [Opitutales bacterium]
MNLPICLLVDNGSLRPEAIFSLRRVAKKLSAETSFEVIPLGLLHSNKIDPALLDGEIGQTIGTFLSSDRPDQNEELIVLPFFFGPSRGITEWLIEKLGEWQLKNPTRSYRVLDPLYKENEIQLAQALQQEVKSVGKEQKLDRVHVALVDHGTPVPEVNKVREDVGEALRVLMGNEVEDFSTCSMERREGDEYSFNEPLLEKLLLQWGDDGVTQVVVALFFLLSGRHAGKEGDLVEICANVKKKFPEMNIFLTKPLGEHEIIFKILKDKLHTLETKLNIK